MKISRMISRMAIFGFVLVNPSLAQDNKVDKSIYEGWRTIRQLDCARCHGASYQGNVGPSLVESVRTRQRETFIRIVLEGNAERGMPPYKSVKRAKDNIDGIYRYFMGRADGTISAGSLIEE